MGRFNSYPNVTKIATNDEFMIDGAAGTRNILASDAAVELTGMISSYMHRNTYRGKYLGKSFTDAQKEEVRNGTFNDLYVADYWDFGGIAYYIVDVDYWLATGDSPCYQHHLVIMPENQLYTYVMNDTNTTEGGYVGSKMYREGLEQAKTMINNAFGSSYILNHRELLVNAVSNGHPSGGVWVDSTVELPSEIMMYGSNILTPANDGQTIPYLYTINKSQLALMALRPLMISPQRQNIWLRDVVSAANFAFVDAHGYAVEAGASHVLGVRPVFGVHG